MADSPQVSVVMAVFNGERYLRQAIDSILWQTMGDFEFIIIDDGSTDQSRAIVASYTDARIRVVENERNLGLATSLNKGIDLACGRFIARMDCDDVSYPERLARQLAALQKDPALDLVAVRTLIIDDEDRPMCLFPGAIAHNDICARPWMGFRLPHPTWMGRTEWFRKYHYTVPDPYRSEDQELLLRSYRDSRFATLDEILFAYRVRRKVDWQKLSWTRRAILATQWRHFVGLRQWRYASLAAAAFAAKTINDLSKRLMGGIVQSGAGVADAAAVTEWRRILDSAATQSKTS